MLTVFLIVLIAAALVAWAVVTVVARSASSQRNHDPRASGLHGSNANFGNSLQGDNENSGKGW